MGLQDPDGDEHRQYSPFFDGRPQIYRLRVVREMQARESHLDWLLAAASSNSDDDSADDNEDDEDNGVMNAGEGNHGDFHGAHAQVIGDDDMPPKPSVVGIQVAFTKSGALAAIALCIADRVLVITDIVKQHDNSVPKRGNFKPRNPKQSVFRSAFRTKVLDASFYFTCFEAHEVALAIYKDTGLALSRLFNLLDHPSPGAKSDYVKTVRSAFGDDASLIEDRIRNAFVKSEFLCGKRLEHETEVAQQAWLAYAVGKKLHQNGGLFQIVPIDTTDFDDAVSHVCFNVIMLLYTYCPILSDAGEFIPRHEWPCARRTGGAHGAHYQAPFNDIQGRPCQCPTENVQQPISQVVEPSMFAHILSSPELTLITFLQR